MQWRREGNRQFRALVVPVVMEVALIQHTIATCECFTCIISIGHFQINSVNISILQIKKMRPA